MRGGERTTPGARRHCGLPHVDCMPHCSPKFLYFFDSSKTIIVFIIIFSCASVCVGGQEDNMGMAKELRFLI